MAGRVRLAADHATEPRHEPRGVVEERGQQRLRRRRRQRLVIAESFADQVVRAAGGLELQPAPRGVVLPLDQAAVAVVLVELPTAAAGWTIAQPTPQYWMPTKGAVSVSMPSGRAASAQSRTVLA